MGFNCEELGAAHEDLIVAYHDAEIARHRREGSFSDDLGLLKEDVLPFVVLMRRFMQDNDIREADLAKPSSPSGALQRSSFMSKYPVYARETPRWEPLRQCGRPQQNSI